MNTNIVKMDIFKLNGSAKDPLVSFKFYWGGFGADINYICQPLKSLGLQPIKKNES